MQSRLLSPIQGLAIQSIPATQTTEENMAKAAASSGVATSAASIFGQRRFFRSGYRRLRRYYPRAAEAAASEYGLQAMPVADLLADPSIDIVINLTIPAAHAEVSMAVLDSGKSVYSEKPLALNTRDGRAILERAQLKGVRVGGAPDTFLGAGLQTCRKLIDDGWIGEPVAATAYMTNHGHESWHPDPEFYYQTGGGPMFDMGPYYLTALVSMLGPVSRVTGSTRITFPERTITSEKKYGKKVEVEVPTHVAGVLDFASGVIGNIITSFDVWAAQLPSSKSTRPKDRSSLPDPNTLADR